MKLYTTKGVHKGGIFSIHEKNGCLVTGSKDGTVAYSKIANNSITVTRTFDKYDGNFN